MRKIGWVLRLCLFYIVLIPITILIATTGWLFAPFPAALRYKIITSWSHFFIWWCKTCCGLRYKVSGRKNLPRAPYVVLCNHQSTWETIFMQVLLPAQSWVLKRELLFIPFFGWGLALLSPITVLRSSLADIKIILQQGLAKIAAGRVIVFYPEGTRLPPGQHKKYSRTGAALAITAKVPVVPIAHNAGVFWPRGPWIKSPGVIQVKIGPSIDSDGHDASSLTEQARTWIQAQ